MIPLSMTLSDPWPHFKVMKFFFEDEYRKNVYDKDKVTIVTKKLYVTCGMAPCLLTSTDR